jgi:dUTP pyrophosphatase
MTFLLKCFQDSDISLYESRQNLLSDSGLDIFFPTDVSVPGNGRSFRINLGIALEKVEGNVERKVEGNVERKVEEKIFPSGYYLYPRSSISKTGLIMANSIGIIDNGYRGELIVYVHNLSSTPFEIKRGTSLFQVCNPDLKPVSFVLSDNLTTTERGNGGFGSTSKNI